MLRNCLFCLNGPVSDSQNRPRAEISGALCKNRNVFNTRATFGTHSMFCCLFSIYKNNCYTIFNNLTAPDIE